MSPTAPSNPHMSRSSAFAHQGKFSLNGQLIEWREKAGGEIIFKRLNVSPTEKRSYVLDVLVERMLPDGSAEEIKKTRLAVVNKILAHYRPHALPDANGYYAASAAVVARGDHDKGTLYVAVNNEHKIKQPFVGRGCGETSVLGKCQLGTGDKDVQLRELYLMSGRASKKPSGTLQDSEPLHVACLCGECRHNLRAHTQHATFYMLPTNSGELDIQVNATAKNAAELASGEVWELDHATMYPLPEYRDLSPEKADLIMAGYDYIADTTREPLPLKTWIDDVPMEDGRRKYTDEQLQRLERQFGTVTTSMPALKEKPTLENVNRAMLQLIKEAYTAHAGNEKQGDLEITTIVVKTKKGDYFSSVLVDGEGWLPSKPHEVPIALTNAYNQRDIVEVYMMTFDEAQMRTEKQRFDEEEEVSPRIKLPNPLGLGRLLKNMHQEDNPMLHVLPINDGTLDEEALLALADPPIDVREAFGPGFAHPKHTKAQERGG